MSETQATAAFTRALRLSVASVRGLMLWGSWNGRSPLHDAIPRYLTKIVRMLELNKDSPLSGNFAHTLIS